MNSNSSFNHGTQGTALMRELREGWSPLPNVVVLSLVLAGLRVRLSRSVVTVMTVVLAIAFLTYTGLSGKLDRNLVKMAVGWSGIEGVPGAEAQAASKRLLEVGILGEVDQLPPSAVNDWVPETPFLLKEQLKSATGTSEKQRITNKLKLRESMNADSDDGAIRVMASEVLREEAGRLLGMMRNPGTWSDIQLAQASSLQKVAASRDSAASLVLERIIASEQIKRKGMLLSSMLRRAGVNIEAVLRGEGAGVWVIVMALILCTVGIANAMLMSVTERFREIGTMKCLGAQDGLVVKLFLLESAFMGVAGALLGILLGIIVTLLAGWLQYGEFAWEGFPFIQGLSVMGYSLLAGIFLAVAGTLYPATLAARMKPVDALRIDE